MQPTSLDQKLPFRIATSYFYQVRNFHRNMLPVSTAVSDPLWYHAVPGRRSLSVDAHSHQGDIFVDRRGIYNGFRAPILSPAQVTAECHGPEQCQYPAPSSCPFILNYRQYLESLSFFDVLHSLMCIYWQWQACLRTNNTTNILSSDQYARPMDPTHRLPSDPILVLMVHEAPENLCSERQALQQYFTGQGITCLELQYPISASGPIH